jgi:nucleoside-diphosphate-sugar epimerase
LTSTPTRIPVTGGAGFAGADLSVALAKRHPGWKVRALDNLKRRVAELELPGASADRIGEDFPHDATGDRVR